MPRGNGSFVGHTPNPTASAASGIWRVSEAERYLHADQWPSTPAVPGAPTGTAGDGEVSLSWSAPASGPSPNDYIVQYSDDAGATWVTFADGVSTATSAVVTGLTNGTPYIFRVVAVNALGQGPYGSASGAVTPVGVPEPEPEPLPSLLLHFDTDFTDSSNNHLGVMANGNVEISAAQSRFGGTSAYFNGGYLSIPANAAFGVGTGDFTIEMWTYPISAPAYNPLINLGQYFSGLLWRNGYGNDSLWLNAEFTDWHGSTHAAANQWTHLALVRVGSAMTVYANGVSVHTRTSSADLGAAQAVVIGADAHDTTTAYSGYIDELRILKGTAAYTGNFTPPTAPFANPPLPSVVLLHFDGTFSDSSGNNVASAAVGNAQISTAQSKFGAGSFTSTESGAASRLDVAAPLDLSSGSWTLECWFKNPAEAPVNQVPILATNQATFPGRAQMDLLFDQYGVYPRVLSAGNAVHRTSLYATAPDAAMPIPNPHPYTLGEWEHVAFVNNASAGEFAMYVGGVKRYSSGPVNIEAYQSFEIGTGDGYSATGNSYYLDEFRIVTGRAVYTGNFTPPTAPFA